VFDPFIVAAQASGASSLAPAAPETSVAGAPLTAFMPDLFTGSARFTVPIDLPPFRPGTGIDLNLRYLHGVEGILGRNWDVALPKMTRSPRLNPVFEANDFELRSGDASGELLQIAQNEFRLRADPRVVRVERVQVGGSPMFVVTSPDGTRTYFGDEPSA